MSQTILITGASSGFGEACASLFAEHRWNIVLVARRQQRLESLAQRLDTPCHVLTLDVRDPEAVKQGIATLPAEFSAIDVLVNNAGLALGRDRAQHTDLNDWHTMVDTNIKGVLNCTWHLLPRMVDRNQGHIVNIGSIAAGFPYAGGNVYGATKAFVRQFSRNLKMDLLGTQIRVTNIEPGMAETEFSKVRFKGSIEKAKTVYLNTRPLHAEDIAQTVYWAVTQPPHVTTTHIEIMATDQAWAQIHREKTTS